MEKLVFRGFQQKENTIGCINAFLIKQMKVLNTKPDIFFTQRNYYWQQCIHSYEKRNILGFWWCNIVNKSRHQTIYNIFAASKRYKKVWGLSRRLWEKVEIARAWIPRGFVCLWNRFPVLFWSSDRPGSGISSWEKWNEALDIVHSYGGPLFTSNPKIDEFSLKTTISPKKWWIYYMLFHQ